MKKNFAGQPAGGGNITILTAQDLMLDVVPAPPIFQRDPLFVDNCKNCNMENFVNAEGFLNMSDPLPTDKKAKAKKEGGGFFSGINFGTILDTAKTGAGIWAQSQQNKSAAEQAQLALQIERQRLEQERARAAAEAAKAEAEAAKSGSAAGKVKAYIVPIAVTGVVVIAGIAAYFYFKKKKVN